MSSEAKKGDKKSKTQSPEEIISGFNILRTEQRSLAVKISEFEYDVNEHNMVIETLKNVDGKRKCHRLTGGVLVEKQVEDVLPALITNKNNVEEVIGKLKEQLTKKGQELNEYKEKHNIRLRSHDDPKEVEKEPASDDARGNVLVFQS